MPDLISLGGAAMLSAGVLVAFRGSPSESTPSSPTRAMLPEPSARIAATGGALRSIGTGARFVRVETAIRAVAISLVEPATASRP